MLVARREERLKALAAEIVAKYPGAAPAPRARGRAAARARASAAGVKCHCFPLDMMDIPKVEAAATLLPADFAEVDILVNNAGLALGKATADENATEDVVRMMTTNVSALIVCTATFAKGMKKRGRGHVINVGSVSGHEVYGGGSAYCASKRVHAASLCWGGRVARRRAPAQARGDRVHVRGAPRLGRHADPRHVHLAGLRGDGVLPRPLQARSRGVSPVAAAAPPKISFL